LLGLLLLSALNCFVLVLHLVEFELEQAREFLLLAFTATPATVTVLISKRDLNFAEDRIGGKQSLQRALFGWKRIFARLFSQWRRRAFHLFRGLLQVLGHFLHLLLPFRIAESPAHTIEKLERVYS
jgi:hypothetical protein